MAAGTGGRESPMASPRSDRAVVCPRRVLLHTHAESRRPGKVVRCSVHRDGPLILQLTVSEYAQCPYPAARRSYWYQTVWNGALVAECRRTPPGFGSVMFDAGGAVVNMLAMPIRIGFSPHWGVLIGRRDRHKHYSASGLFSRPPGIHV